MEIITDASAIMAVVAMEPEREKVIKLTKGVKIICPDVISYEIANSLTKMMKKKIINKEHMLTMFGYYEKIIIKQANIDFMQVLEIAWSYKIYSYDACYLELAKRLKLPLLTFDNQMAIIGKEMGINILGE